eukprot:817434_1
MTHNFLFAMMIQAIIILKPSSSQSDFCIWGRSGHNFAINGLYKHQGIWNTYPYYKRDTEEGSGSPNVLYVFWSATHTRLLIHSSLDDQGDCCYARCTLFDTAHHPSECDNSWQVWDGSAMNLDSNVYSVIDACPSWQCDEVSIPSICKGDKSHCGIDGCGGPFDQHIEGNVWKNNAKKVYWYFWPYDNRWVCSETYPADCKNTLIGVSTAYGQTWTDLAGGSINLDFQRQGENDKSFKVDCINHPTNNPSRKPTHSPSRNPSSSPTPIPTIDPSMFPTTIPTSGPITDPSSFPTTNIPSVAPTNIPTHAPTINPTSSPTPIPTSGPTIDPSSFPTISPTYGPTTEPTYIPTSKPINSPPPTKPITAFPTSVLLTTDYVTTLEESTIITLYTISIEINCDDNESNECDVNTKQLEQRILIALNGDVELMHTEIVNGEVVIQLSVTTEMDNVLQTNVMRDHIEAEIQDDTNFGDVEVEVQRPNKQKTGSKSILDYLISLYLLVPITVVFVCVICGLFVLKKRHMKKTEQKILADAKTTDAKTQHIVHNDPVRNWIVNELGLGQYVELFIANGYEEMDVVMIMKEQDLQEIGIENQGHRAKIMAEIEKLKDVPGANDQTDMIIVDDYASSHQRVQNAEGDVVDQNVMTGTPGNWKVEMITNGIENSSDDDDGLETRGNIQDDEFVIHADENDDGILEVNKTIGGMQVREDHREGDTSNDQNNIYLEGTTRFRNADVETAGNMKDDEFVIYGDDD